MAKKQRRDLFEIPGCPRGSRGQTATHDGTDGLLPAALSVASGGPVGTHETFAEPPSSRLYCGDCFESDAASTAASTAAAPEIHAEIHPQETAAGGGSPVEKHNNGTTRPPGPPLAPSPGSRIPRFPSQKRPLPSVRFADSTNSPRGSSDSPVPEKKMAVESPVGPFSPVAIPVQQWHAEMSEVVQRYPNLEPEIRALVANGGTLSYEERVSQARGWLTVRGRDERSGRGSERRAGGRS